VEGRDQETLKAFKADLVAHGGDPAKITEASVDMSPAFIKGLPHAVRPDKADHSACRNLQRNPCKRLDATVGVVYVFQDGDGGLGNIHWNL
jgi:hypothetical protein